MTRWTIALLTTTLLGVAGTASASDIDDLDLVQAASTHEDDDAARRGGGSNRGHGSASRGHGGSRGGGHASPARGRPNTVVHTTPARPGRTVVHTTPGRPGRTVVHRGPARRNVVVRRPPPGRVVTYRAVRPYHGVFVYGPRPVTHVRYVNGPGPYQVAATDLPRRAVDRDRSFALGLKGGSLVSGSNDGGVYGDAGLGLVGRYRPSEGVGLELAVSHHASGVAATRAQTQGAASVELFAFPWAPVSPYVLGGATFNRAAIADGLSVDADGQTGLHAGLGLEFALGRTAALDLEGRYIGWVSPSEVNQAPGAFQATAGLLFHFN